MNKKLFFSLCWILLSCQMSNKTLDNKSSQHKDEQIVISLTKGMCFGNCPVYKIEIFNNKKIVFEGKKFVDSIGTYKTMINDSIFDNIINKSNFINFYTIKENQFFNTYVRDLPTTKIKIHNNMVKYNEKPTQELLDLENEISKMEINEGYISE